MYVGYYTLSDHTENNVLTLLCPDTGAYYYGTLSKTKNTGLNERVECCKRDIVLLEPVGLCPRSGELRTQKLKSHLARTQGLNLLPLKPGVGQYIATNATLTARDFFLVYFYTSGPSTCIFSKTSPDFSCVGCG